MPSQSSATVRELLALFSFGVDTSELKKGESNLSGFFSKVKGIATAIAGAFLVHEIGSFVESTSNAIGEIKRMSLTLGLSTDKTQEYMFAARSLGMEVGALTRVFGRLQVAQAAASEGQPQATKAFRALGISTHDTTGHLKGTNEMLLDTADAIAKITDPAKRAEAATKLFGREGRQLLPMLTLGRKGLEELGIEFQKAGGGYSAEVIALWKKYQHESAKLDVTFEKLTNTMMKYLYPAFTRVKEIIGHVIDYLDEVTKSSKGVEAGFLMLKVAAGAFTAYIIAAAWPVVLLAGALLSLWLILDDLMVFFAGGDSLLGRGIDKVFGENAKLTAMRTFKDAVKDVADELERLWNIMVKIINSPAVLTDFVLDRLGVDMDGRPAPGSALDAFGIPTGKPSVAPSPMAAQPRFNMDVLPPGSIPMSSFSSPAGSVTSYMVPPGDTNVDVQVHLDGEALEPRMVKVAKNIHKSAHRDAAAQMNLKTGQ